MSAIKQKLLEYSIPEPNSGCWLWTRGLSSAGYGQISIEGRQPYAHRVSYETNIGPIPPGVCVCHKCDTPACINPDHLFLGTKKDNSQDCTNKNRRPTGNRCSWSKIPEDKIESIKSDPRSYGEIAKDFNVSAGAIGSIKHGKNWKSNKSQSVLSRHRFLPKGEIHHNARLTEEFVRKIRTDSRTRKEIANEYGVAVETVGKIKRGVAWPHVK